MKTSKKVNVKRLSIFLAIIVVIIVGVIVVLLNRDKKAITLDSPQDSMDGISLSNKAEIEYDGNPYNVPELYVENEPEYKNEVGEELDNAKLEEIKANITAKFKSIPADKLKLDINPSDAHIVFNKGTTTIADYTCIVFAVYENVNDSLIFKSKYAMSIDTNTIYVFETESLVYHMIEL